MSSQPVRTYLPCRFQNVECPSIPLPIHFVTLACNPCFFQKNKNKSIKNASLHNPSSLSSTINPQNNNYQPIDRTSPHIRNFFFKFLSLVVNNKVCCHDFYLTQLDNPTIISSLLCHEKKEHT